MISVLGLQFFLQQFYSFAIFFSCYLFPLTFFFSSWFIIRRNHHQHIMISCMLSFAVLNRFSHLIIISCGTSCLSILQIMDLSFGYLIGFRSSLIITEMTMMMIIIMLILQQKRRSLPLKWAHLKSSSVWTFFWMNIISDIRISQLFSLFYHNQQSHRHIISLSLFKEFSFWFHPWYDSSDGRMCW